MMTGSEVINESVFCYDLICEPNVSVYLDCSVSVTLASLTLRARGHVGAKEKPGRYVSSQTQHY
jgi:hypothetical protein